MAREGAAGRAAPCRAVPPAPQLPPSALVRHRSTSDAETNVASAAATVRQPPNWTRSQSANSVFGQADRVDHADRPPHQGPVSAPQNAGPVGAPRPRVADREDGGGAAGPEDGLWSAEAETLPLPYVAADAGLPGRFGSLNEGECHSPRHVCGYQLFPACPRELASSSHSHNSFGHSTP